jgi:basic membrane protein A
MDSGEVTDPYIGYVGAYPYAEVVSATPPSSLASRASSRSAHGCDYTTLLVDITAGAEAANSLMSPQAASSSGSTPTPPALHSAVETALEAAPPFTASATTSICCTWPRRPP